jgi:hypothetical protein
MKTIMGRHGVNLLIWAGSGLLAASAVLHFHLWSSEGYRHIPTIGPLFLAQAIIGLLLAAATALFRRLILVIGAAGLAASSVGALLISIWWGLFGWQDSFGAPYVGLALAIEVLAAVLLGAASVMLAWPWLSEARTRLANRSRQPERLSRTVPFPPSGRMGQGSHPSTGTRASISPRERAN